jgi:hypothetical protein
MRTRRFLFSIAILTAFAGAGVAPAAASPTKSWIHDGYYAEQAGSKNADVEFNVVGNGTKMLMGLKEGGVACTASASLITQDPNDFSSLGFQVIHLPTIAISPSGAFSFNGDVTLPPPGSGATMTFTLPVTLRGHFIKGKIVARKTIAVVGTFSAPGICAAGIPTRLADQWDVTD